MAELKKDQVNIWIRIIIYSILIIGGLFIFIPLVTWLKGLFDNVGGGGFGDNRGYKEAVDFDKYLANQSELSFEEAKSIADQLENAMYQEGTDEPKISQLLKNLNAADFELVYAAFGKRLYYVAGGLPGVDLYGGSPDLPLSGTNLNLAEWFDQELKPIDNWLVSEVNPIPYLKYLNECFSGTTAYPGEPQMLPAWKYMYITYPYSFGNGNN
jgi:hypothetical protein